MPQYLSIRRHHSLQCQLRAHLQGTTAFWFSLLEPSKHCRIQHFGCMALGGPWHQHTAKWGHGRCGRARSATPRTCGPSSPACRSGSPRSRRSRCPGPPRNTSPGCRSRRPCWRCWSPGCASPPPCKGLGAGRPYGRRGSHRATHPPPPPVPRPPRAGGDPGRPASPGPHPPRPGCHIFRAKNSTAPDQIQLSHGSSLEVEHNPGLQPKMRKQAQTLWRTLHEDRHVVSRSGAAGPDRRPRGAAAAARRRGPRRRTGPG
mmetsp:Transcript_15664/g.25488  ORF Transcript_15664/g.25488 Transcript_15664/m.25488 type:complete len:259 (-) Transcript_15664:222-998(-)